FSALDTTCYSEHIYRYPMDEGGWGKKWHPWHPYPEPAHCKKDRCSQFTARVKWLHSSSERPFSSPEDANHDRSTSLASPGRVRLPGIELLRRAGSGAGRKQGVSV